MYVFFIYETRFANAAIDVQKGNTLQNIVVISLCMMIFMFDRLIQIL